MCTRHRSDLNGADSAQALADAIATVENAGGTISWNGRVGLQTFSFYDDLRSARGWPTPIAMRRAADALDLIAIPKYGGILRWFADLCDGVTAPSFKENEATAAILPACNACSEPALPNNVYCKGHDRLGEYRVTDETHWAAND